MTRPLLCKITPKLTGYRENLLKFYPSDAKDPLSNDALEEHETSLDTWEQKQAQVHKLIYNTVDSSTFLQIKTAADLWKKLISIHGNKGAQQRIPSWKTSDGTLLWMR